MTKPSAGAMRAATVIVKFLPDNRTDDDIEWLAGIVDEETGLPEMLPVYAWATEKGIGAAEREHRGIVLDSIKRFTAKASGRERT